MGITAVPLLAHSEDADALVKKGIELRRQGHDREALAEFQRAFELQKVPRIVAQLALAEQAVGLWVKADEHMAAALEHREDPWIEKNRVTLETSWQVVKSHIGSVDVWGTPDGAEILLDGRVVGKLPMNHPAKVAETQVTLQVRAPGSVEITRMLQVRLGDLIREHVELRPLPPVGGGPAVIAPPPVVPPGPGPALDDQRPGNGRRTWAWITGAGAVAFLTLGAVEMVAWSSAAQRFDDHLGPSTTTPGTIARDCGSSAPNRGGPGCASLYDDAGTAKTFAIVGFAAGGLLAAGSAFLFATSRPADGANARALACGPTLSSSSGLLCRWSF
jgi:hypothetical protein